MAVHRIVANLAAHSPQACAGFYETLFGLETVMNLGWVTTVEATGRHAPPELSLVSEGGAGTELPALSIEVDDLEEVLTKLGELGIAPAYGPKTEDWGVRRFFVRDPAGTLLNVLSHVSAEHGA